MKAFAVPLLLGTSILVLGSVANSFGQATDAPDSVESRLQILEKNVATLDDLLRLRTDVAGIQDRTSRDYNVDMRLTALERSVQQLGNQLLDLQRQVADANRMALQAQGEAQMAQSLARDAANRIR
jgi:sensor histidine kinase YesM